MKYRRLPVADRLLVAGNIIYIIQEDNTLQEGLSRLSGPHSSLTTGKEYHEKAQAAFQKRLKAEGLAAHSTQEAKAHYIHIRNTLIADRNIARIALKEHLPYLRSMAVGTPLKRNRPTLIRLARIFYTSILQVEPIHDLMRPYNFAADVVQEKLNQVEALQNAMESQTLHRAEATIATQERNNAMAELDDWMHTLFHAARVVFANEPSQLTKMGL